MALSTSLVAHWSLADLTDNVGSNTLTNNNSATFVTGKVGNGVDLESSSSQYLSVADNAGLSRGDTDWSIAAWVKPESQTNFAMVVSKGWIFPLTTNAEFALYINTGTGALTFEVCNSTTATAVNAGAIDTGSWTFIVVKHDSVNNQIGISKNGGAYTTASHSAGMNDGTGAFAIGASISQSLYWDGLIDELGLWGRVLSDAEVTELYNGGAGRDYAYISSAGGGTQTVTANLVASTATVYAPTVTTGAVTVAPNLISSAATVYQPTVSAGAVTVSPNLIASAATVYQPTVTVGAATVTPDFVASAATVYSPTVTTGAVAVSPDFVSSAATVYVPVVATGAIVVAPDFIAGVSTVYSPIVALASGPQTIIAELVASAATVYPPVITAGAVTVAPNAIASTAQVFAPVVSIGAITLLPDFIASAAQVYAPTILPGPVTVIVAFIASGAMVRSPTVAIARAIDAKLDVDITDSALYFALLTHGALYRVTISDSTR